MTIAIVNGEVVKVKAKDVAAFDEQRVSLAEQARVSSIKMAAAERIDTIAPLYKQQNFAALRIALLSKRFAGETITDGELAAEGEADALVARIDAIRATSKAAVRDGLTVDVIKWPGEEA